MQICFDIDSMTQNKGEISIQRAGDLLENAPLLCHLKVYHESNKSFIIGVQLDSILIMIVVIVALDFSVISGLHCLSIKAENKI